MTKLHTLPIAQQAYAKIWHTTPFTTIKMIEFSLKKTNLNIEDWVNGARIDVAILERQLATAREHELKPLWKKGGTCASFAVGISSILGKNGGSWSFGDTGFHKATYVADGIVIDSSTKTAFHLKDSEAKAFNGKLWRLAGSELYFLRMLCLPFPFGHTIVRI